jgi:hypothetical protein
MEKTIIQKASRYFTIAERHELIQEWLGSQCSKQEIWEKYTGEFEEHGRIVRWMKQLGYQTEIRTRIPRHTSIVYPMSTNKPKSDKPVLIEDDSFENLQLKKRIAELEAQLKEAEMKAIAYSTMVDIAEKEFKIPIRKKLNTKP